MEDELNKALDDYEVSVKKCAVAESQFKALDSQTKIIIAKGFTYAFGGIEERRQQSHFTDEYEEHIEALGVAREQYLKWKAKRDIDEKRWETQRSILSANKRIS